MNSPIHVFISRGHSRNPAKRGLEQAIVEGISDVPDVRVSVINNLYDLRPDGSAMTAIQEADGDLIVVAWHYPRSSHWTLDRNGIRGQIEETQLVDDADEQDDEPLDTDQTTRVIDEREVPERKIYCLDLRHDEQPETFLAEIRRIVDECRRTSLDGWIGGSPKAEQLDRYHEVTEELGMRPSVSPASGDSPAMRIDEDITRRWYPVIDFSRCTNCLECIDFCLFGVYGIDRAETILVEQPDNCRKGCPACSRVCPENAIIFPQHKVPAIAGAAVDPSGLKIDLSKLFGAPEEGQDAVDVAVRERDEHLLLAGQKPVGDSLGLTKVEATAPAHSKDELDELLDELESCDL